MSDLRSSPIPEPTAEDHLRGESHLPLVVFYGDFSCPFCALTHERLQTVQVRTIFRHFALKSRPRALALATAVEAAAAQGAFWEMHDALYEDPAHTEDPDLWRIAERLGLDLDRFQGDRRSQPVIERVGRDLQSGMRGGVAGTPTLFLAGVAYPGPPTQEFLCLLASTAVR